eukprot:TRINITY_DN3602_c0_g1_i11.p1 TRINITY_DN3602_c0_g1~~TRINITY_DN3602_c0_g1_i11.p1  ORF type:complete len:217 (+),score=22.54 TRINITY_DN3602_c0_g1_i11:845-1495(+)
MNLVKEFVKKLLCQSPHLYQILMDTGDAKLIYCGDYSFWWGNRNVFGQLLEQIRNEGQKKTRSAYDSVLIDQNNPLTFILQYSGTLGPLHFQNFDHCFTCAQFSPSLTLLDVVRQLATARDAFTFVRNDWAPRFIRSDWSKIKLGVMMRAVNQKFHQSPHLKTLLRGTRDGWLIEHTCNDTTWGDGGDMGSGANGMNLLGKILMWVRSHLHPLPHM